MMWMEVWILLLFEEQLLCSGAWSDVAHYFIVNLEARTWNDARETCRSEGTQLLSISNETDWNMWTEILNTSYHKDHRSLDGIYWFGLHAADRNLTDLYLWADCAEADYMAPAVFGYPMTDYQCVKMWIRRQVFLGAYKDMWLKGVMCNETHPFICTWNATVKGCAPTCDELIIVADRMTCDALCDGISCKSTFFNKSAVCHVIPNIYTHVNLATICYLPSVDVTPNFCSSPIDFATPVTMDTNMNVTDDSCLRQPSQTTSALTVIPTSTASPSGTTISTSTAGPAGKITSTSIVGPTGTITLTSTAGSAGPVFSASTPTTVLTTEAKQCFCPCDKLWTFLSTPSPEQANLTVEEKVEIIVQELTMDKKNTTVSQRRYISVMDYRPSHVGIGVISGLIIFCIMATIVLIDLSTIWHEISHITNNVLGIFKAKSATRINSDKRNISERSSSVLHVPMATNSSCIPDSFHDNASKCDESSGVGEIAMKEQSSRGWLLRERSMYPGMAPDCTRLNQNHLKQNELNSV